jgi:hypothetical protein
MYYAALTGARPEMALPLQQAFSPAELFAPCVVIINVNGVIVRRTGPRRSCALCSLVFMSEEGQNAL